MNIGMKPLTRWFGCGACAVMLLAVVGCEKPSPPPAKLDPPVAQPTKVTVPANPAPVTPLPDPGKTPPAQSQVAQTPVVAPTPAAAPAANLSPRKLLERTVKAYAAANGYSDLGYIKQSYLLNGQPYEQRQPLVIAYEKPNKLRLECYNVKLVVDGAQVHGTIRDKDGILELPAPATLTQDTVVLDETMQAELSRGFGSNPLQLLLLFAADPLSVILGDQPAVFLPDLNHHGQSCRRVKITTPAGDLVLWIDPATFVVRRLDYPLTELQKELAKQGEIKKLEQYADFVGAELNPKFPEETFEFDVPKGALLVKRFLSIPAPLKPTLLLGKLSPQFEFKTVKGDKVTADSLTDKVAVLVFWGSQFQPCGTALPLVQQVYDYYRDNPAVEFYAVSVDEANVDQTTLDAAFKAWNVSLPIVRDPKQDANKALGVDGVPSLLVIGKKGLIEHHWPRLDNTLPQALPSIINTLLAGESTYAATFKDYEQRLAEYQRWQQTPPNTDPNATRNIALPTATIAPASAPQNHKLEAAWTIDAEKIKQPGNVFVVPGTEPAATRLLVLDGWNAVVEVDLSGAIVARHELNLPPKTAVTTIRSAVDRAGNRYYVLFHPYNERGQLYLYDKDWKQLLAYPRQEDLGEDRLSDVQIGDVTGDGDLELIVGYSGTTGVQMVSLTGDRLWRNREQIRMSLRMALSEPREGASHLIFCPNEQGTVIPLNAQGEAAPPWPMAGQKILGLFAGGDGALAGLLPTSESRMNVVGLGDAGRLLWSYELPPGLHGFPIEYVQRVRLSDATTQSWLLAGADGSVHLLDERGKLSDRFNTGHALQGVAATTSVGKPLIITVSKSGIQAQTLEPLAGELMPLEKEPDAK